jgi:rubrerythrin
LPSLSDPDIVRESQEMHILDFLDLAGELETTVGSAYEMLAALAPPGPLRETLRRLAREEANHAAVIRTGKNYALRMPDVFGTEKLPAVEVRAGLNWAKSLVNYLDPSADLKQGLTLMRDLEKRFEPVHLASSVEIMDASMKKLFEDLSRDDRSHLEVLGELISSL